MSNVNWQHTFTHLASNVKKKGCALIVKGNYDDFTQKKVGFVEDIPYYAIVSRCVRRSYRCGIDTHSGKNYDLFFLLDNCSCVVLISYAPVTMQNRHTPERRTVPSLSITTVDSGLKTVFVFYRYSLPLTFVALL